MSASYLTDDFAELTEDDVLTEWEASFLASIGAQDYPLTPAQQNKLAEIEDEIPRRLAMAKRGEWMIRR